MSIHQLKDFFFYKVSGTIFSVTEANCLKENPDLSLQIAIFIHVWSLSIDIIHNFILILPESTNKCIRSLYFVYLDLQCQMLQEPT